MNGGSAFMRESLNSPHLPDAFPNPRRRFRFAEFVVDFEQRELFKNGRRQPIQQKPLRVLELLMIHPGCLVSRREIANELWPGLRVSFERNLNTAVNSLRLALGDSVHSRRFIETRAGLGYRFIAPVDEETTPETGGASVPAVPRDCVTARYFLNKMTSSDLHKAIAYYRCALREDPTSPHASAGLAEAYSFLSLAAASRAGGVCQQARSLALSAVESAPRLAEAHVSLACVKMIFDWDWSGARNGCLRALELAPQLADAFRCHAFLLSACGEHHEALRAAEHACALDPISLPAGAVLAASLFWARDFAAAERQCWNLLTLEPRFSFAQTILGMVYEQQSCLSEAVIELKNARSCSDGDPASTAALAHALARTGERNESLALLQSLESASSGFLHAIVRCGLSEYDAAMESLEQAVRERDPLLISLQVDPRLDPLRSSPRFDGLLQRVLPAPPASHSG